MLDELKGLISKKANNGKITFWFIRHGQSESNAMNDSCPAMHDTPLTARGKLEAERVAAYFKNTGVQVTDVYTSSLSRSYETAEIIAKTFDLPVKARDGLSERNWGVWRDLRWMDVSERLEELSIDERYLFIPEGGESWKEMERRLFEVLIDIAGENEVGENIVIVVHRGGLRAILPRLVKKSIETHAEFSVETGSITKYSFVKDALELVGLIP